MGTMADISTPATSTAKGDLQDDKTHASQPLSNAEDPKIDSGGAIDSTNLNSRAKPKKRTKAARWQKAKQREIRRAKEKEIQLAEKRAEMEKQIAAVISLVQTDIQNLVETEKRKSEQYLSLARKYYSMWKILNDERSRQKSTSMKKQTSPQENDSTFDVPVLKEQNVTFPLPMTSVTMNKRFSENSSSEGKFQILGETLNVSSRVLTK